MRAKNLSILFAALFVIAGAVLATGARAEGEVPAPPAIGATIDDFSLPARAAAPAVPVIGGSLNLEKFERQVIERALRAHHFNISLAASELGLSRGALYRRMEKYGL